MIVFRNVAGAVAPQTKTQAWQGKEKNRFCCYRPIDGLRPDARSYRSSKRTTFDHCWPKRKRANTSMGMTLQSWPRYVGATKFKCKSFYEVSASIHHAQTLGREVFSF